MANGKNPNGVSFIQTAAGAMITGEIKRYATYKDLMAETAPTRLATVSNASRDEDYDVPQEHVGGILYQRDFLNSTWILLYTDADLAIPTFVEWDHILNVPKWVGGVSNNRVKLVQDSYAVPRTTYYSFGNYRLVLPPASHPSVQLGDEIVLEQYENFGWVLYEHVDGEYTTPDQETKVIDGITYNIIYTIPYYDFEINPNTDDPVYGQPINACSYKFICTETNGGTRCWRPEIIKDNISALITDLRKRDVEHLKAGDPHTQYILKEEARNYLWSDVSVATSFDNGTVRLANDYDMEHDAMGAIAVTPYRLKKYTTETFSVLGHTHDFDTLTNIPFVETITDSNKEDKTSIVTPNALTTYTKEVDKKQNSLKSGRYISIQPATIDGGQDVIDCTIPEASEFIPGIAKLITFITTANEKDETSALTPAALTGLMASRGQIWNEQNASAYWPSDDEKDASNGKCQHGLAFTSAIAATGSKGWIKFPLLTIPSFKQDGKRYCLAVAWGQSDIYYMKEGHLDLYITMPTGRKLIHKDNITISRDENSSHSGGILAKATSGSLSVSFNNTDLPFGYCKFYRIFTPITKICPYYSLTTTSTNQLVGWPCGPYDSTDPWSGRYLAIVSPDGYTVRPAISQLTELADNCALQFGGTFGHINTGKTDVDYIEGIRFMLQKPPGESNNFGLIGINWTVFGIVDADSDPVWSASSSGSSSVVVKPVTSNVNVIVEYDHSGADVGEDESYICSTVSKSSGGGTISKTLLIKIQRQAGDTLVGNKYKFKYYLRTIGHGHWFSTEPSIQANLIVDFKNSVIDMNSKTISNVAITKYAYPDLADDQLWTDGNGSSELRTVDSKFPNTYVRAMTYRGALALTTSPQNFVSFEGRKTNDCLRYGNIVGQVWYDDSFIYIKVVTTAHSDRGALAEQTLYAKPIHTNSVFTCVFTDIYKNY